MKAVFLLIVTNLAIMLTLLITYAVLGTFIDFKTLIPGVSDQMSGLMVLCLFFGFGSAFVSLALSKYMAKKSLGVRLIDEQGNGPLDRESNLFLYNSVRELAEKAGIGMPEVGVFQGAPNAFATGASKNSSLVAVSTGLLNTMGRQEVKAVIAHEVAHIKNGDMVTLTLIQGSVNAFSLFLSRILANTLGRVVSRGEDPPVGLVVGLTFVFDILFSILGSMVVAAFSRKREYRADYGAAALYSKGAMVSALAALGNSKQEGDLPAKVAAFGINSSAVTSLFRTHPSLEDRIVALQKASV